LQLLSFFAPVFGLHIQSCIAGVQAPLRLHLNVKTQNSNHLNIFLE
jgi:hypothetical protein